MKKHTWDNPNKMHFESPHKTFNRQCRLITVGNQIGDVVYSNYIRPYTMTTNPVGEEKPQGYLQNWDLTRNIVADLPHHIREEVKKLTRDTRGIIYNFHHWNGDKRIDDGFVLTAGYDGYKLIKVWYINPDWRARGAVDEAIKYITN